MSDLTHQSLVHRLNTCQVEHDKFYIEPYDEETEERRMFVFFGIIGVLAGLLVWMLLWFYLGYFIGRH